MSEKLYPIDYIVIVFSILGTNIFDFFPGIEIPPWVKPTLTAILLILYIAFRRKPFQTTHSFKENSNLEAKFFANWYSRPGELSIFCTDLEWLDDKKYSEVVTALEGKGSKLFLYLKHSDHPIVKRLIAAGAHKFEIKDHVRSMHRFSLRVDGHLNSIIIRNKEIEPEKIMFEEYPNHRALVNLALDMLDDCYVKDDNS